MPENVSKFFNFHKIGVTYPHLHSSRTNWHWRYWLWVEWQSFWSSCVHLLLLLRPPRGHNPPLNPCQMKPRFDSRRRTFSAGERPRATAAASGWAFAWRTACEWATTTTLPPPPSSPLVPQTVSAITATVCKIKNKMCLARNKIGGGEAKVK